MKGTMEGGTSDDGTCCLRDYGRRSTSCGYCEVGTATAHHVEIGTLDVMQYQKLLNRGWRRCGMWLYQPVLEASCCRTIAMRVRAVDWKPNKELKKCVRRMDAYLNGERRNKAGKLENTQEVRNAQKERTKSMCENALENAWKRCMEQKNMDGPRCPAWKVTTPSKKARTKFQIDLCCSTPFSMAAWLLKRGDTIDPHTIAVDVIKNLQAEGTPIERMQAEQGFINIFLFKGSEVQKDEEERPRKINQMATEGCKSVARENKHPQQKHRLDITIVPARFEEESYELFFLYQTQIHKQAPSAVSRSHYLDFLVSTPFPCTNNALAREENRQGTPCPEWHGYGTFHHQYKIDGKLVAVGVVDILPECLSSKYLFWHPDYHDLSLGKYSAIEEIQWVARVQKTHRQLQYYYPGYYLPSCPKMAYKAIYQPAGLLCPLTYKWVPFSNFDHSLFQAGSPLPRLRLGAQETSHETPTDIYGTKVVVQVSDGKALTVLFRDIMLNQSNAAAGKELYTRIMMWHSAVGPDVAKQAYYLLN